MNLRQSAVRSFSCPPVGWTRTIPRAGRSNDALLLHSLGFASMASGTARVDGRRVAARRRLPPVAALRPPGGLWEIAKDAGIPNPAAEDISKQSVLRRRRPIEQQHTHILSRYDSTLRLEYS